MFFHDVLFAVKSYSIKWYKKAWPLLKWIKTQTQSRNWFLLSIRPYDALAIYFILVKLRFGYRLYKGPREKNLIKICSFYAQVLSAHRVTSDMSESSSTKPRHLTWESLPQFCDIKIFRFHFTANSPEFRCIIVRCKFLWQGKLGGCSHFQRLVGSSLIMWFKSCPVISRSMSGRSIINF